MLKSKSAYEQKLENKEKWSFADLIPGVNFTNILKADFAPTFLAQKKYKPQQPIQKTSARETFVWKSWA